MKKYYIQTFGCQSNKSDSERVAGDYEARGFIETKNWQDADEIVVNTCAIRQTAEDRARGFLYNVATYFQQQGKQKPKIILTGCMTHHGQEKLYEMMPMIDEILPINEVGFNSAVVRKDKKHAWVPISAGCNSFCTYCIVPYSRGREQSRPMEDILAEVEKLVKEGYSEITLLGQNVNSWGLEKEGIGLRKLMMRQERELSREEIPDNATQYEQPKGIPPFVQLLQEISKHDEIKVIRFITSNPWDFHDLLIDEIATNPKIDRFIHLPIQSGSNKVLYDMNRGYTKEHYRELVRKLREKIPDVVIGTDIIVGFPGETEEDFNETVEFAKEMNWKLGFVAQYSPRPGTASWRLYKDTIPQKEKKRRWEILDKIINKDNLSVRPHVV
ncbi:tRNA (N6-isopentenyl adenosine(37)-C2)-methylthiotransferase MiaB [Candidatus Cerribacteria bacterium 'Amazon FNV 2010 28 9']|uniref:tRNA-2-methylthio-N(6)-dimethylallyladenosine synthase n=1 Tax=Candidatus Cerribacteria bacterium 'Amazon FNV 2010 28 9' TaxID=2081795 RepID=A0A317JNQ7_9BACT|nr:MAG: tRNA (N6-isopentenyl adenosine(37)-C2)-methylthiotransferase MiaB [Candidatus Cerribacteria bacterium 'Amazon FNV 2010 28 9']